MVLTFLFEVFETGLQNKTGMGWSLLLLLDKLNIILVFNCPLYKYLYIDYYTSLHLSSIYHFSFHFFSSPYFLPHFLHSLFRFIQQPFATSLIWSLSTTSILHLHHSIISSSLLHYSHLLFITFSSLPHLNLVLACTSFSTNFFVRYCGTHGVLTISYLLYYLGLLYFLPLHFYLNYLLLYSSSLLLWPICLLFHNSFLFFCHLPLLFSALLSYYFLLYNSSFVSLKLYLFPVSNHNSALLIQHSWVHSCLDF